MQAQISHQMNAFFQNNASGLSAKSRRTQLKNLNWHWNCENIINMADKMCFTYITPLEMWIAGMNDLCDRGCTATA